MISLSLISSIFQHVFHISHTFYSENVGAMFESRANE